MSLYKTYHFYIRYISNQLKSLIIFKKTVSNIFIQTAIKNIITTNKIIAKKITIFFFEELLKFKEDFQYLLYSTSNSMYCLFLFIICRSSSSFLSYFLGGIFSLSYWSFISSNIFP